MGRPQLIKILCCVLYCLYAGVVGTRFSEGLKLGLITSVDLVGRTLFEPHFNSIQHSPGGCIYKWHSSCKWAPRYSLMVIPNI